MYHWKDHIYFGRNKVGGVRILAFDSQPPQSPTAEGDYPDASFDVCIDKNCWASIISGVSAGGEVDGRFYAAEKWHASKGSVDIMELS